MTYTLVALFLLTGDTYIERDNPSLQGCAGQAAIARQDYLAALPRLNKKIGPVIWKCEPEFSLSKVLTEQRQ